LAGYADGPLTREVMGAMLNDAYHARFAAPPAYMTDYNGKTSVPAALDTIRIWTAARAARCITR